MSTIEIRKLTKKFGDFVAVRDADLNVAAGEFLAGADDVEGDVIEFLHRHREHAVIGLDGQTVGGAQLDAEVVRVDLHGLVSALKALAQRRFDGAPEQRFLVVRHVDSLPQMHALSDASARWL